MIATSKWSGKSDLFDTIKIYGVDNIIAKYNIYSYQDIIPLKIEKSADLIPYYPYIVSMMYSNKEEGGTIILPPRSFVDAEEKEILTLKLDNAKKYFKQCKRKKEEFDENECIKCVAFFEPSEHEREIVKRVKEQGEKATIEGIHTPMHDRMRQELYDEMVNNGWNEDKAYRWCFGWQRWLKKNSEKD